MTEMTTPVRNHRLDLSWGQLAYRRTGSGQPLLLLHSLALSGRMWEPVVAEFARRHDVVMVDLRGHGQSTGTTEPFSVADLAGDLEQLLDHLEWPKAHVIGLSMGGSIAVTFAAHFPTRVDRLGLCDTTAWYGPEAPTAWAARAASARSRPRHSLIPFQVGRWFSDDFARTHAEMVSHVVRIFLGTRPQTHALSCEALGAFDARHELASITAPTLVVTGEQDYATPPDMGKVLAEGIPAAQFRVWPESRHFAILESAELRGELLAHLGGAHEGDDL